MTTSKELVKQAIEFRNPERVPYNFDSNRTPVIAEKYGDDFEWVFARVDPAFKPKVDKSLENKSQPIVNFALAVLMPLAACAAAEPAPAEARATQKRPNVIFVLTDDQRWDTIRALNNPEIITPNLDRLAACGVAFDNAYIMGGTSPAVCMPSRAMLMTGRSLFHLQKDGEKIPASHVTLAELLRKNGYDTFCTGKYHNGTDVILRGFTTGANIRFGGGWGHYSYARDQDLRNGKLVPAKHQYPETDFKNTDEGCTDAVLEFLDQRDKQRPFYAYVAFFNPHDPLEVGKEFRDLYPKDGVALPPNFVPEPVPGMTYADLVRPMETSQRFKRTGMKYVNWHPLVDTEMRDHLATYYAMVSLVDKQVGRIMDQLEKQGELDNTIIIFSGDNGLAVGQHGILHKQSVYDHSVHVPLIMAGPGIPKNQRRDTLCYNASAYATICDLIGIKPPATVDLPSLTPAFKDPNHNIEKHLYLTHDSVSRAIYDGRYKLIEANVTPKTVPFDFHQHPWWQPPYGRQTFLFDRKTDPWEMHDLSKQPEHQQKLAELRKLMLQEKARYQDNRGLFWNGIEFAKPAIAEEKQP